ncbi:MAG: hypothetical protein R2769_16250 [Saprospiraceae bacterium]
MPQKDGSVYNIYRDGLKNLHYDRSPNASNCRKDDGCHMKMCKSLFGKPGKWNDPWKYKADSRLKFQLRSENPVFERLVQQTDRYQQLRDEVLSPVFEKNRATIRWPESDRLGNGTHTEEKKSGAFSREIARKNLSPENGSNLKALMEDPLWKELKTKYNVFKKQADEMMNKKVPMTVFAYNDKMEKDTMSPLDSIKYHRMFLQTGILAVDPVGGYVKVWIGGINHKYFQFDHVQTQRQVGMTFKPFVYAIKHQFAGNFSLLYRL